MYKIRQKTTQKFVSFKVKFFYLIFVSEKSRMLSICDITRAQPIEALFKISNLKPSGGAESRSGGANLRFLVLMLKSRERGGGE